jgi:hypothetical protein
MYKKVVKKNRGRKFCDVFMNGKIKAHDGIAQFHDGVRNKKPEYLMEKNTRGFICMAEIT